MKKIALALVLVVVNLSGGVFAWTNKVNTKLNFDWWEDSNDDKGYQFYIPIKFTLMENNFTFDILSGYCYTVYNPADDPTESMGDVLDTKINLGYELIDRWPVDVLFGLDFNLPTGRTKLSLKELSLIMDPDLVSIISFGEGFNINPTINIAKDLGNLTVGVGFGYLMRGEYDYASTIKDYDPGDIYNLTGEIQYQFSPSLSWYLFGQYTYYEMDKVQDESYYQEGKLFLAGTGLSLLEQTWEFYANLQAVFRGKSRYNFGPLGIKKEDHSGYGNEWVGTLGAKYYLPSNRYIGSTLEILYIDKNDYPKNSPFYLGAREKVALTLTAGQRWKNLVGELSIRGILMHDDENWFSPENGISYRGFSIALKLISYF